MLFDIAQIKFRYFINKMNKYNKGSWKKGSALMFAVACLVGDSEAIQVAHRQHLVTDLDLSSQADVKLQSEDFNFLNVDNQEELEKDIMKKLDLGQHILADKNKAEVKPK